MKHSLLQGSALLLFIAVAAHAQEVQTVRSVQTWWKHNGGNNNGCSSCSGYYPPVACGIVGCLTCSVYGQYTGMNAVASMPRGAQAPQICGCAQCDTANGYQLLSDGSCGCAAGYGSFITLDSSTIKPSTLPTTPPTCPPWGGFYYPYRPSKKYGWSHMYAGGRRQGYYAACMCRACPAGFTSAGGAIASCNCYPSGASPTPPTPSPSPPTAVPTPSPSPSVSPAPPASPAVPPARANSRRSRLENVIMQEAQNAPFFG